MSRKSKSRIKKRVTVTIPKKEGRVTGHGDKRKFDQLLTDAIFGVPEPKSKK